MSEQKLKRQCPNSKLRIIVTVGGITQQVNEFTLYSINTGEDGFSIKYPTGYTYGGSRDEYTGDYESRREQMHDFDTIVISDENDENYYQVDYLLSPPKGAPPEESYTSECIETEYYPKNAVVLRIKGARRPD